MHRGKILRNRGWEEVLKRRRKPHHFRLIVPSKTSLCRFSVKGRRAGCISHCVQVIRRVDGKKEGMFRADRSFCRRNRVNRPFSFRLDEKQTIFKPPLQKNTNTLIYLWFILRTNGRFKFLIDTNCFKTDVYFIFLRINKNCFFLCTLLKRKCNHRLRWRTWRKHRDARIFPEARYDIDPTRFPDSAESARGERKIKKKEKLGAEQSLDFKTIQGFIRGLELFSLLTSVS